MVILNWMGEHPILTFLLVYITYACVVDVANAIGSGLSGRCDCVHRDKAPAAPKENP